MKLQPMLNKLLLKKFEEKDRVSSGGIFMPDNQQQQTMKAVVVAVGTGNEYWDANKGEIVKIPLKTKPGDKVVVPRFNTSEVIVDGENYIMINENEIFGILVE